MNARAHREQLSVSLAAPPDVSSLGDNLLLTAARLARHRGVMPPLFARLERCGHCGEVCPHCCDVLMREALAMRAAFSLICPDPWPPVEWSREAATP